MGEDIPDSDASSTGSDDGDSEDASGSGDADFQEKFAAKRGKKKKKPAKHGERDRKRGEGEDGEERAVFKEASQDHYKVLGLGGLKWRAGDADIKKAYRKMVLKTHPDKNPDVKDGTLFEAVSLAFDVLSNAKKRRAFDSQYDYDDSLPDPEVDEGDFYELFAPVFDRNARWSEKKPVPALGEDASAEVDVDKFYDFWFKFKSWRDFSLECEHNPETAHDRFEKRWMLKENEAEIKKKKAKEMARIRKLVEMAYGRDPRIQRRKDERKKQQEASQREREERLRRETEERAEKERKEKEEKEAREKEEREKNKAEKEGVKKRLKKGRQTLRAKTKDASYEFVKAEKLAGSLALEDLEALCEQLERATVSDHVSLLDAAHAAQLERERQVELAAEAEARKRAEEKQKKDAGRPWTREELSLFAKAVARFPGGTVNRWQEVAAFVGTRTSQECAAKMTDFRTPVTGQSTVSKESFEDLKAHKKRKEEEASELDKRYDPPAVTAKLALKEAEEMRRQEAEEKGLFYAPPPAAADEDEAGPAPSTPTAPASARGKAAPKGAPKGGSKPATPTAAPAEAEDPNVPPSMGWSKEQQQALEKALQKHPASVGKERWTLIAADVPGRTKDECKNRYKTLVDFYAKKKKQK